MSELQTFLGREPLGRLMVRLAIPTMVAQIVNLLYNLTDRIFIGHIPGTDGLALTGVGVCFPLIMMISAFAFFVGSGGSPLASYALGQGDRAGANRIVGNMVVLVVIFAAVAMIGFGLGMDALLPLFGASDATISYAREYLSIYLVGTLFAMGSLVLDALLLAQGESRFALVVMALGAVVNIALDAAFIFGCGWGVKGAAFATLIAQASSAVCAFLLLRRRASVLRVQARELRLNGRTVKSILTLGSAPFFMNITEALMVIVFNSTLLAYGGDTYVGAMVVLQSFCQMFFAVSSGFTQGVQPIISYCYGAGLRARVEKAAKMIIACTFILVAGCALLVITFPGFFANLFSTDESIKSLIVSATPVFCASMVFFGLQMGMQTVFMGMKQGMCSLAVAGVRKLVFMIPLALILPQYIGAWGVYVAEPISDACSIVFCSVLFAWRIPRVIRTIGAPDGDAANQS